MGNLLEKIKNISRSISDIRLESDAFTERVTLRLPDSTIKAIKIFAERNNKSENWAINHVIGLGIRLEDAKYSNTDIILKPDIPDDIKHTIIQPTKKTPNYLRNYRIRLDYSNRVQPDRPSPIMIQQRYSNYIETGLYLEILKELGINVYLKNPRQEPQLFKY